MGENMKIIKAGIGYLGRLVAMAFLFIATAAYSQDAYPSRPVKVVVPWPAGGVADVVVRVVTEKLADRLKQPFVIDNRPGANGIIGTQMAARPPPTATRS